MLSQKSIIWAVIGAAVAFVGFLFSDEEQYPVAAKFSGVMIIAGVALLTLAVAPKWNPIA